MAWTKTAPSGVTWGNTKTGNTGLTWNHFRLYYECSSARLGTTYYLRMRVKFTNEGQNGTYYPPDNVYFWPDGTKITKGGQGAWSSYYYRSATGTGTSVKNVGVGGYSDHIGTGYPSWTQTVPAVVSYTISYNANGHGTAPASQTKYKDVTLALRAKIANVASGGGTQSVTITGNANGGTWTGSNGSAQYTAAITTYSQRYWCTNSGGTGTTYNGGANYTANAGATLYAIWTSSVTPAAGTSYTLPTGTPSKPPVTNLNVTVTFDPNGGVTTKATQDASQSTSYTFDGWYTAPSGGTKRTTASRVTAAETVYAHYVSVGQGSASVTLPSATQCTRSSYILAGWAAEPDATTATWLPATTYYPSGDDTVYAVWEPMGLPIYTKVGNDIKQIMNVYTQVDETIYPAEVYVNDNGTIKKLE